MHLLALVVLLAAPSVRAAEPRPLHGLVTTGIGLPSMLHASAGAYVHPRVELDVRYGFVIFNPMVGLGATGHLLGQDGDRRPPKHSLLVSGEAMLNHTRRPLTLRSGADIMAAYAGTYAGYGFLADTGFVFRAQSGGVWYHDAGFAAAIDFRLDVGWAF
jgi:hypothetical protein